jgi:16S rRNA processing protein RimM
MDNKPKLDFLIVARVLRPHGVRGDLNVKMLTSFPDRMRDQKIIYLGTDPEKPPKTKKYQLTWARPAKGDQWIMHINGVDSREDADMLRSHFIYVSMADAVPLEEDEVYLFQVLGLTVETEQGEVLGKITGHIETGANDVYIVQSETYGEVLIPHAPGVILKIDVNTGIMRVNLPEGLLPEPKEANP